jgi:UDP-glucuronate decarboxylase
MASSSDFDFVVAGATGWLGQATLAQLYRMLGADAGSRVHAFASSARSLTLADGTAIKVRALAELPGVGIERPAIVFHYAFQTKDAVGRMPLDEYLSSNAGIRQTMFEFIDRHRVAGMFVPSSGAAYAGLVQDDSSDAAVYGRCKLDDERLFTEKAAQQGFKLVLPRVFNMSGPYINKHDLYALASIILACLNGQAPRIRAAHPVWRSYYAVDDLIHLGLAALLDNGYDHCAMFDTAGNEVIEIGELAQRCVRLLRIAADSTIERPFVHAAPNDYYAGDPAAIRSLEQRYGFKPRSLDQQILDTASYLNGFVKTPR